MFAHPMRLGVITTAHFLSINFEWTPVSPVAAATETGNQPVCYIILRLVLLEGLLPQMLHLSRGQLLVTRSFGASAPSSVLNPDAVRPRKLLYCFWGTVGRDGESDSRPILLSEFHERRPIGGLFDDPVRILVLKASYTFRLTLATLLL